MGIKTIFCCIIVVVANGYFSKEKVCNFMGFSEGQQQAYNAIMSCENVFLTGEAVTGKSYVIKKFIENNKYKKRILVCAPTGVSAINVDGSTIHRAFKIPIDGLSPRTKLRASSVVSGAEVVIIDEISMCRFDVFSAVASILKRSKKPKQLVVVGDFFQLAPILSLKEKEFFIESWLGKLSIKYPKESILEPFPFLTEAWQEFKFHSICLTEPMRQKDDIEFLMNLNKVRIGDNSALSWIANHCSRQFNKNSIYLCGRNDTANMINEQKLAEIMEMPKTYKANIVGRVRKSDVPVEEMVTLKKGCRIMTVVNDTTDGFYVNGSLGTVKRIFEKEIIVDFDNGNRNVVIGTYTWDIKEYQPQVNVVTQYRNLTGYTREGNLKLTPWKDYQDGDTLPDSQYTYDGTELIRTITRKTFELNTIATFTQLPVKLAYAVTIHKSQGQTYDSVTLDPRCFSAGQLYVALSRVRKVTDLFLAKPLHWSYLKTSKAVLEFYNEIDLQNQKNLVLPSYPVTYQELKEFEAWWKTILEKRQANNVQLLLFDDYLKDSPTNNGTVNHSDKSIL